MIGTAEGVKPICVVASTTAGSCRSLGRESKRKNRVRNTVSA
jgi:hypothetical protein